MREGRSLGEKISTGAILASIGAAIVFILLAAVSGIIGGRADAIFVWLWDLLAQSITANSWPWILTFVLFLTLVILSALWWLKNKAINSQLASLTKDYTTLDEELATKNIKLDALSKERDTLDKVVKLDNSLLRLLPILMSAKDLEKVMRKLVKKLLEDASGTFAGDVHRASLFLPDASTGGDYLKFWEGYQMPEESIIRTRFYIGSKEMDRIRGVAGEAFFNRQLRVGHIMKESGHWEADSKSYIDFDKGRPYPPYRSFVNVPLIFGKDDEDCLGVVCFDSENSTAFDDPEVQKMLEKLGTRIAAALLIYQQLQMVHAKSQSLPDGHNKQFH